MSRNQYIKLIEKELHEINKKIDEKILTGQEYFREARDHKLLMKKLRQHTPRRSFFGRLFPSIA